MTDDKNDPMASPDRLSHYNDAQAAVRAMLALDAGQLGCWEWDIAANRTTGDPFLADLFDLDYADQPWPTDEVFAAIHPEDLDTVQAALGRAMDGDGEFDLNFRELRQDPDTSAETVRWLEGRGRVTERSEDGTAVRMIGVTRDVTREKQNERKLTMLAGEMDHRVKNAFAVIRSLINLGERAEGDKRSFARTLKGQVQAMADAHALSAALGRDEKSAEQPIPVLSVIRSALAPWSETTELPDSRRSKVDIAGDEDVAVNPRDVSALAMLVYELATNAAKYGPLGREGGELSVRVTHAGDEKTSILWRESVPEPMFASSVTEERQDGIPSGFGSMLLQHCVSTMRGRIKRELTETGLHIDLHIPVPPATIRD